jgi:hypothetical protein
MSTLCACGHSKGPMCDGSTGCHFSGSISPIKRVITDFTFGTGVDTRKSGDELIAEERAEQVLKHGRPITYDLRANQNGELLMMAEALIYHKYAMTPDNWDRGVIDKMMNKTLSQRLVIAGALIAAEIDRLALLAQIKFANENE